MSQTACYNNSCITHDLDKHATGYYPRKKKSIREITVTNSKDKEFLLDRYNIEIYYNILLSPNKEESNPNKWQDAAYKSRPKITIIIQLIGQTKTLIENLLGASSNKSSKEEQHKLVEKPRISLEEGKLLKLEL